MDELTTLYRQLALDAHPDRYPASERDLRTLVMQQINDAYRRKDLESLRMFRRKVQPPPSSVPNPQPQPPRLTWPKMPDPPPLGKAIDVNSGPGTLAGIHCELKRPQIECLISGSITHFIRMSDLELANTPEFLGYARCMAGAIKYIGTHMTVEECVTQFRRTLLSYEENLRKTGGSAHRPSNY